jgi:flagellar protein FlgJ
MIDSDLSGKLAIDANGLNALKTASKSNSPESVKAVSSQFEAMFVNMMLKSMRDATPQDGMFDNEQTKAFTSMLDQQLSQKIASHGIGLAEILTRQLTKGPTTAKDPTAALDANAAKKSGAVNSTDSEIGGANLHPQKLQSLKDSANVNKAFAPTNHTLSDAAASFKNMVASHAEQVSRETGIPAHFMVGQAALESGWGKREIKGLDGTPSNNLFGIKATSSWKGKVVEAVTTEYVNGVKQKRIEKFRAYDSYAETFKDFANLMQSNPRYSNVMANLDNVSNYAKAIQQAGYATDPNYASKLISVVKKVAV